MQNSCSYGRFRTLTRFETEAQENSEMAYLFGQNVLRLDILIMHFFAFHRTSWKYHRRPEIIEIPSAGLQEPETCSACEGSF